MDKHPPYVRTHVGLGSLRLACGSLLCVVGWNGVRDHARNGTNPTAAVPIEGGEVKQNITSAARQEQALGANKSK